MAPVTRSHFFEEMDFRSLALVSLFLALPVVSLLYAWRKNRDARYGAGWREKLLSVALPFASLSLLLTAAFLVRGWHWNEQGFTDRPPTYWAILNGCNSLSWVFACFAVLTGKGELRKFLLAWCISLPLFAWIVFMLGFNY
jgi:hypothetical protein